MKKPSKAITEIAKQIARQIEESPGPYAQIYMSRKRLLALIAYVLKQGEPEQKEET